MRDKGPYGLFGRICSLFHPTKTTTTDDDGDVCALADAAARATLRNGGAIRVVEELPEEATVGAVLRY